MSYQNISFNNPEDIVNAFAAHFRDGYSAARNVIGVSPSVCGGHVEIVAPFFGEDDVVRVSRRLKPKLSSGPDFVPSFFVKDTINVLALPLSKIFNLAISSERYPSRWKIAKICPVFKSGNRGEVENYRPISLICGFSKLFEMLLYEHIVAKVEPMLSVRQHGFMRGRSTATNLACFVHFTSKVLDLRGQVDVVFTDFSKAFDRIDHGVLLDKVVNFGFTNNFVRFFRTYLVGRSQYVQYNGFRSDSFHATSGVPQGSNLGPLLFIMFMNDIQHVIDVEYQIFADDLKLYVSVKSGDDCERLQSGVDAVQRWCVANGLLLNAKKCLVMTISRKASPLNYTYNIGTNELQRVETFRDLGVVLDSRLSFSHQINTLISDAMKMMGFVVRNCKSFQNIATLITVFNALVRSRLEYGSVVWAPFYSKYIVALERVQRKFLKYISKRVDGVYPQVGIDNDILLGRFNFLSLKKRRSIARVMFLYKLVNGRIQCPSLLEELKFIVPRFANRVGNFFYLPMAHTNVLYASPVYGICSDYNKVSHVCDLSMTQRDFFHTCLNLL